ncbi:LON peptidase substrate-binding domain-containing protein [Agriterribacter humi]|uniref:LON peptidase substrate-binding domain-containing protein n=1 Tax=Agriterribacter humi TaxID=1104781 RepID=UPI00126564F9|nr:LON peptidase substrate-binding domain-containing protein [Agriterribacter humi]
MTNFIPIFPLSIVVFPGEEVNLHIFEPRYKQLVKECFSDVKPFGIPCIINNQVGESGTLVKVVEIVKVYDSGEMDIRTKGVSVFRILEIIKRIPDKLYSGAIVHYPNISENGSKSLMEKVLERLREMHRLLKITKSFNNPDEKLSAYDIAHHAGLSIEEEYELLGLTQEIQRQEYLKRHLNKIISILTETEALKEKIKLNGHFKNPGSMDI